ncbi:MULTISPECIES: response regulator [unclassified Ensifer]|uniref:response regulator n=1 Tax=unclassified Ensifer TaxID=2633371 RepID=UPI001FCD9741|nr:MULTISPECIES: response regulator [unclassified Ensifer]
MEDDAHDARFVMRAFAQIDDRIDLVLVTDADEAVEQLTRGHFDYILMDIKLPGSDGIDLLRRVRKHRATALVPIIVLTSSINPADVLHCYGAGANAYVAKPSSVMEYRRFAEAFIRFWVESAILPPSMSLRR